MSKLSELFDSLSGRERKLIEGVLKENTDELISLDVKEFTLKLRNSLTDEGFSSLTDDEVVSRGELMDRVIVAWRESQDSNKNSKDKTSPNSEGDDNNNKNNKKIELAFKKAEEIAQPLFKDQYGVCHGWLDVSGHKEVIKIEGSKFKRLLNKLYYDNVGQVPSQSTIDGWMHTFHAIADFEGPTYPLAVRVAWYNGDIYYDLTNETWSCIKITPRGWEVLDRTPIPLFARYNQIPQAYPDRNYDEDIFDRFLLLTNLKDEEDRILLSVYIVSLFIPDIPHVISQVHGEKGSAKSTLQTLIKLLVDPAKPTLLTIYNDVKEFIQQLAHNYIAFYDNLKYTPRWLSDEACKAVTGVGSTKRKLYSDDDDIVYEYRRGLGFNGINLGLTEPDILDRSIMIELQRIRRENTKQDSEVIAEFFELRPKLLAYIFDILVKALQIKPTIKLNDLPRMADFTVWGEAIARAMGYRDLEFIDVYYDNIDKQNIEAVENSPLAQTIAKFLKTKEFLDDKGKPISYDCSWQGPMSKALEHLNWIAEENNVDTSKFWPKSPNTLSRKLKPLLSNLREGLGINISIFRNTAGSRKVRGTYFLRVSQVPQVSQISSLSSPSSPDQLHEGNEGQNGEDISGGEDTYLHQGIISSPKNTGNEVQNPKGEDSEHGEDIFSTEGVRQESDLDYGSPVLYTSDTSDRDNQGNGKRLRCYYCDTKGSLFETNSESEYFRHGNQKHLNKPMYPNMATIKKYGLKKQGKRWEV